MTVLLLLVAIAELLEFGATTGRRWTQLVILWLLLYTSHRTVAAQKSATGAETASHEPSSRSGSRGVEHWRCTENTIGEQCYTNFYGFRKANDPVYLSQAGSLLILNTPPEPCPLNVSLTVCPPFNKYVFYNNTRYPNVVSEDPQRRYPCVRTLLSCLHTSLRNMLYNGTHFLRYTSISRNSTRIVNTYVDKRIPRDCYASHDCFSKGYVLSHSHFLPANLVQIDPKYTVMAAFDNQRSYRTEAIEMCGNIFAKSSTNVTATTIFNATANATSIAATPIPTTAAPTTTVDTTTATDTTPMFILPTTTPITNTNDNTTMNNDATPIITATTVAPTTTTIMTSTGINMHATVPTSKSSVRNRSTRLIPTTPSPKTSLSSPLPPSPPLQQTQLPSITDLCNVLTNNSKMLDSWNDVVNSDPFNEQVSALFRNHGSTRVKEPAAAAAESENWLKLFYERHPHECKVLFFVLLGQVTLILAAILRHYFCRSSHISTNIVL